MRKPVAIFCTVLLLSTLFNSFAGTVVSPYEVGKWSGFKSAAITYTLDDGCAKQFTVALPMFNEYDFDATLFTVTGWSSTNWSTLQSAAAQGHEIGSHTVTHLTLSSASTADQTTELANAQNAINTNITAQKCRTVAYPNCTGGSESICSQYYIAGRTCTGAINPSTPSNFFALGSFICGSEGSISTLANFTTQATSAASSNGWCVYLIHGIDDDGGYSPLASGVLRQSLDYFNTNRSAYWVSTFLNVSRYIKERNDVSVSVASSSTNSITLQVTDNLDNTIYNYPVTIRRPLPSGWTTANVTQGGNAVTSSIVTVSSTQYLMFDVVPDGGSVVLTNPAGSTTGIIDVNTRYQTMDGFGGGITWGNNTLHANSQKNTIFDLLFNDLGLTIVRLRNVYGRSDASQITHDQQTYAAAKARNANIKFLLTSWSPPANLKDNGSVLGNGDNSNATLIYSNGSFVYNDFASYWLSSYNSYVSSGVSTIDYVSIQNEPDYDASWEACRLRPVEEVYNGKRIAGYNTCLDRVYAQLPAGTKFLGPEATGVINNKVQDFVNVLDQNKLAVVAHHLYNGGDTANPDAYNANLQALAAQYPDKTIWQTETDQCSPFKTAWLMHNCIVEGRASAYIHWKATWNAPDTRGFIAVNSGSGYSVNKYFYYFKQFSKYISAGHRRIAATSSSSDVKMSAYLNPAGTQITAVLINKGTASQTMTLNIGGYPISSSSIYRTSSSENFASIGAIGSGNTVTLPAQSVSTVVLNVSIGQYAITASAGSGGTISPSGTVNVAGGSSPTFTITPSAGYQIAGVLVDGASVGTPSTYTFSSVNAAHTISATFTAASGYIITASAGSGGAISPTGAINVATGASQTFTITPSAGYQTASVLVDGVSAGTPSTYTFSSVSANHTISATFSSPTVYRINCGAGASSPFTADQYSTGGTQHTVTNTITISGITNPAPAAVYQSERYGTCTYTLPSLTAGSQYTVRLHFCELYQTATGKRVFNVAINGTTVLSNLDLYAVTGARYKAYLREFTATANSSGQIVINLTTVTDNATIGGIEIIRLSTNAAPTIATAAAAAPNPVAASTTTLSVLGADDNGESALTYTWAATGTPPAAVTFSASGTNAAKATTATFTKAGSYTLQATVTDAGGLTAASPVNVTVNQTLTTIVVTPTNTSLAPSATLQFTASSRDQFGTALSAQPAITWSLSGGGTIDATGLFTAGTTSGTFAVTALGGSVSGTANVIVNTAPEISTAAAATPNPANGTTAALSVLGADDNGETNLTYTWATTGTPPAAVSFSSNGTNAAKTATATFTKAGNYTIQATIRDGGNLTVTSIVAVTVNQTLTSILISPTSASVAASATQQFTATARDQFATSLSAQPTFTWSVSGGGTISSSGLFTAGTAAGGPYTITASSNGISGTASITVVSAGPTYRINCGGSASSPFTADQYFSGGTAKTYTNTITISGITNPAPQAVYQAERYGNVTYTMPSLTVGAAYTVRLHFAELYQTATGKRKFNVAINGTTVLSNFDIYAAAGARYKAILREFTATANSSGQIVIQLSTVTDNATIEGIEIIRQ